MAARARAAQPLQRTTEVRRRGRLDQPNTWRDIAIHASKNLGRAIDYLQTRPDIDARRLTFYGLSAGAGIGHVLTAIEPRFEASILMGSGLPFFLQPAEARSSNFLPRVRVPTLMINGRKDFFFPMETAQEPMFRMLGASPEHKRHRLFDSGHIPPEWQEVTREIRDWLDRYLGPVGVTRNAPRRPEDLQQAKLLLPGQRFRSSCPETATYRASAPPRDRGHPRFNTRSSAPPGTSSDCAA